MKILELELLRSYQALIAACPLDPEQAGGREGIWTFSMVCLVLSGSDGLKDRSCSRTFLT